MHNAWSKSSKHYSGLFSSFNREVKNIIGRVASGILKETTETKETIEPNIVVISVTPLYTIVGEDTYDSETTEGSNTMISILTRGPKHSLRTIQA